MGRGGIECDRDAAATGGTVGEVAVAVRMFGPSASGIDAVKAPFTTGAAMELMTTWLAEPLTVPDTVVGLILR